MITIPVNSPVNQFNARLKFFYRSGTCDEEIFTEAYRASKFFAPEYAPREDHTILDIGAHIGIFSLLAAEKLTQGRVFSIEANEENYSYLTKNVELNAFQNVSTYLLALTNYRGTGRLHLSDASWGHSLDETSAPNDWQSIKTDTLTNFMTDNHLNRVNYMKVNVEGAEYDILLSTPGEILRRIELMNIEFHPSKYHDDRELTQYLEQCGFLGQNWS